MDETSQFELLLPLSLFIMTSMQVIYSFKSGDVGRNMLSVCLSYHANAILNIRFVSEICPLQEKNFIILN